jgi:hypothetical protein
MPQTSFRQSAATSAKLTAEQREALGMRSQMMELIVGARHAIAHSRILLADRTSLLPETSRPGSETLPRSERIPF